MQLLLDPSDLKPEFQENPGPLVDQAISTRDVTFDKLNDKAQQAVRLVGRSIFYAWDKMTYNAVWAPQD